MKVLFPVVAVAIISFKLLVVPLMEKFKIPKAVQQINSAEFVASVDDLLTEILLRLPIKSLIRFKSVSKHWQSLIMNPKFCHLRSRKKNPPIGLFLPISYSRYEYVPFYPNETSPPFEILKLTKDPFNIRILQSCNGLFLCSTFWILSLNTMYCIYNPTTKQFSTLPYREEGILGISLCFDPTKSPHYKVVGFRKTNLVSCQILIYSSDTSSWRVIEKPFTAPPIKFENVVYWNGALHWISRNVAGDSLYFDIEHQVFEKMPMPQVPEGWEWRYNCYFGESCDHLHFIGIYGLQAEFNVYEMKRDYSEWFVRYRVDISTVVAANIQLSPDPMDWQDHVFSVFCMVRGEEEEDSFLGLEFPWKAIRYNLVSKTFEELHKFDGAVHKNSYSKGFQYIESLSCV